MNSLKVGPIIYPIEYIADLKNGDVELDGWVQYNPTVIQLEAGVCKQRELTCLWHEALHAILTQSGRSNHDHNMLDALSYGIIGVLKDNEWFRERHVEERDETEQA